LSFGGNPDAIDGHFSAVAVGDLNGDGTPDFLWASGSKSGSPAVDQGYVQMVEGVNYCEGQDSSDPLPEQCFVPASEL